jgi:hypothetical protein
MNRNEALDKAKELISGGRDLEYGSPEDSFTEIAAHWSIHLKKKITPEDVALMMIYFKAARLSRKPDHVDSWLDIAGYAANGLEVVTK